MQTAAGIARAKTIAAGEGGRLVKGKNFRAGPGVIPLRAVKVAPATPTQKADNIWINGGLDG